MHGVIVLNNTSFFVEEIPKIFTPSKFVRCSFCFFYFNYPTNIVTKKLAAQIIPEASKCILPFHSVVKK